MASLNLRFHAALPTADTDRFGVMLHAFDGYEKEGSPWEACERRLDCQRAGGSTGGRISASLIYRRLHLLRPWAGQAIPLFHGFGTGMVLHPNATRILCGYPGDGSTQEQNCDARTGEDDECIPGCTHAAGYCDPTKVVQTFGWECLCGIDYCNGRPQPWRPTDIGPMLAMYDQYGVRGNYGGYNELVVDSMHWNARLPKSIEAFYFETGANEEAKRKIRSVRAAFLRTFGSNAFTPLVRLDVTDWRTPFALAEEESQGTRQR